VRPRTIFVASFVGTANVVRGTLAHRLTGSEQPFSVRPEHVRFAPDAPGNRVSVEGRLVEVQYHGATSRYEVQVEGNQVLTVSVLNGETDESSLPRRGDTVRLAWAPEAMVQLEPGGG